MNTTKRIKLVIAYDGTNYCGWAKQAFFATIQGKIEEAISNFQNTECTIIGSSRTDSGAHAEGAVCHFDTYHPIPPNKWKQAINNRLPSDIRIQSSKQVPDNFDARFSAKWRCYRYTIGIVNNENPLKNRFRFDQFKNLNTKCMQEAATLLQGVHDFRAFSEEIPHDANTVRTLKSVDVTRIKDEVRIDIIGNAFIRGMMRRISGGLYEVGKGTRSLDSFKMLLDPNARGSINWPVVLPAHGLCLKRVVYGRHPKDFRF